MESIKKTQQNLITNVNKLFEQITTLEDIITILQEDILVLEKKNKLLIEDNNKLINNKNFQLNQTLTKHSNTIYSIAFSYDGLIFATGSEDLTIQIYTLINDNYILIQTIDVNSLVYSLIFTIDNQTIVAGCHNHLIKILKKDTKLNIFKLTQLIPGHNNGILSVTINHNNNNIISASADGTIKIWEKNKLKQTLFICNIIYSVKISPDFQTLICTSLNATNEIINIWSNVNTDKYELIDTLDTDTHTSRITSLAWAPDSSHFVSCSFDRTIKVWYKNDVVIKDNVEKSHKYILHQTLIDHTKYILSVSFSTNENYFLSTSADNTIKIWKKSNDNLYRIIQTLKDHTDEVWSAVFSPDNKYIISGSKDTTIKVWF